MPMQPACQGKWTHFDDCDDCGIGTILRLLQGSARMAGRMKAVLLRVLLIAGLFSQGMCIALLLRQSAHPAPTHTTDGTTQSGHLTDASDSAGPEDSSNPDAALFSSAGYDHQEMAEQHLRTGNTDAAIAHLLAAVAARPEAKDDGLEFRLALCLENASDFSRAIRHYETVFNRSPDQRLVKASRAGLARCRLAQGDLATTRHLLWRHYLASGHEYSDPFDSEIVFLLAAAHREWSRQSAESLLVNNDLARSILPSLRPEAQIAYITNNEQLLAGKSETASVGHETASREIQVGFLAGKSGDLGKIEASCLAQQSRLIDTFRLLSSELAVSIDISDVARETASREFVSLRFARLDMAALLDALTLPFDLAWKEQGGRILVFALREAPAEVIDEVGNDAAIRLLERFHLATTSAEHSASARSHLAGLYFEKGNITGTRSILNGLLSEPVSQSLRQQINFNLGLLALREADLVQAIKQFNQVIDSNVGGFLASVAYARLGQIYIQTGQLTDAITAYSRAGIMTDDPLLKQIAEIGISTCRLLRAIDGQPPASMDSGQQIAFDHRFANVARAIELAIQLTRESVGDPIEVRAQLLTAVSQMEWTELIGNHGEYLQSILYRQLALKDEELKHLRSAASTNCGQWLRNEILNRLLECLVAEDSIDEIRVLAATLPGDALPATSALCQLRLAEMELRYGNEETSLRLASELLTNPDASSQYPDALRLMGTILRRRGLFHEAALCFAGLMPPLETIQSEGGKK
jgi:tetratricopeptide (TPR) repeat protein